MALVSLLRRMPLFEGLAHEEMEALASLLRLRSVKKGDVIFRKGDEGTNLYAILRGCVRITVPTALGDEIAVAVMKDGEFFGEMALLDGMPRSASASAGEETQLAILERSDFLKFLAKRDHAIQAILMALSWRLRKTDDLISEICFSSLSQRLAKRIMDLADDESGEGRQDSERQINMTQKELSEMLGVSRESVNKELKVLRDKEIVRTERGKIIVSDLERLKKRSR
jgi:CRP-like cAMP-binding protein